MTDLQFSSVIATISLPISVQVSNNKKFTINLNHYRNAHYHTLNRAKKGFKDSIAGVLHNVPFLSDIKLVYRVYPPTGQSLDVANICSIADKFFSDALVEFGKISDDNFKIVRKVEYEYGSVDKQNPRIEVDIHDLTLVQPNIPQNSERHFNMKIVFQKEEILAALQAYVTKIMHLNPEVRPEIELAPDETGSIHATMDVTVAGIVPTSALGSSTQSGPTGGAASAPNLTGKLTGTRSAVQEALKEAATASAKSLGGPPKQLAAKPLPEAAKGAPEAPPQVTREEDPEQADEEPVSLLKTKPEESEKPVPAPKTSIFSKVSNSLPKTPSEEPKEEVPEETSQKAEADPDPMGTPEEEGSGENDSNIVEVPENPSTAVTQPTKTGPATTAEKPRPSLGISIGVKKQEPASAPAETQQSQDTGLGGTVTPPQQTKPSLFSFKKP